jgi:uncharacterized protein
MWEFKNRNSFGATAFSTYGGFWIGIFLYVKYVALGGLDKGYDFNHDIAWILLVFGIFNAYMLLLSTQVNLAVFVVFLTLEATEVVGAIAGFKAGAAPTTGLIQTAGYIGMVTAVAAWYASAAAVSEGMAGKIKIPLGKPLL